jgi:hypothetical protein
MNPLEDLKLRIREDIRKRIEDLTNCQAQLINMYSEKPINNEAIKILKLLSKEVEELSGKLQSQSN